MSNNNPLSGRLFISTCTDNKADRLKNLLERKSAGLLMMPLIYIEKADISPEIKYMQDHISSFDWVFFTSGYSIRYFFEFMDQTSHSPKWREQLKFAVIGKSTEKLLSQHGIHADFVNTGAGSLKMAEHFLRKVTKTGKRILIPTGNLADKRVTTLLLKSHEVFPVEVYRTKMTNRPDKKAMDVISSGKYDMILFLSPSAFHNFLSICHPILMKKRYRLGCIGQTTAKAIASAGFVPEIVAGGRGIDDLVYHLEKHYSQVLT
ncbi:MAG: uroporphyrinogen-III synthase [Bacteroidales bacterium]|nr:uroporphyrinogen-III synthase [Bacteroidales bacterium]